MGPASWPCTLHDAGIGAELAIVVDHGRPMRLLIVPALFEEANKLRHLTVEVMRHLDELGVDSFLPDLPGCNESLQPLHAQTLQSWSMAIRAAAEHFRSSAVLGIRGGCLLTSDRLPTLHYAPVGGASIMRQMLRARILASREAGHEENREELDRVGRSQGITLAGYNIGANLYQGLVGRQPMEAFAITQQDIGGSGLWLRAEPDHDPLQSAGIAARVMDWLK